MPDLNNTNSSNASSMFNADKRVTKGIQINLRKSIVATQNLLKKCEHIESGILFIQEPRVVKNKIFLHHNLKLHYQSGEQARAAIAHTKDLNIMGLPHLTDGDMVSCLLTEGDGRKTLLISAYWDITSRSLPPKLEIAVEWANRTDIQFIICMDTNAHSTLWGSPVTNTRGNTMEDFMAAHDIDIANIGQEPTFKTYRENRILQSIIDLTLIPNMAGNIIQDWKISDSYEGSDHRMIHFTIGWVAKKKKWILNYRKCDWGKFRNKLQTEWQDQPIEWSKAQIDQEAETISRRINAALAETCPKTVEKTGIKLGFWNDELHRKKHEHRASHHKMMSSRSETAINSYKQTRREYKKLLRRAKRQEWQDRTNNIQSYKDMAKLNKTIQQENNNRHIGMVKKADGTLTESEDEMAKTLLEKHFPGRKTTPDRDNLQTKIVYAPSHPWITLTTFKQATTVFKDNKAAGPDEIKPIVLKNLPDNVILRLCTLFSATIDSGYTPQIWRRAKVIFIPKPGKKDYTDPDAFRPILLTSFTFKTLERLVLWRLEETVLKNKRTIHPHQHGFRRGQSTEIPLSKLTNFVEAAFKNKEYAVGIFLDIIGAFNNVTHQAIIKAMTEARFPQEIISWYGNYTQTRQCEYEVGGKTHIIFLKDGTSQGGILSPIMFNLVINILLLIIESSGIRNCICR
jgi:hypothetical protein